jgi:uncharacterized protein YjbI with pentapeptide repeats
MSIDKTVQPKSETTDTFGQLDDALSGHRGTINPPKPETTKRDPGAGFLLGLILSLKSFLAQNSSRLTQNIGIFGLIVSLVAIVQTQRQLATSQNNFKTEVEIQTKSTSALLINDYLNELNASNFHNTKMTAAEEEFLGAKTRFLLNGISHSTLRAEVLTFMGSTPLRSFISATPRETPSGQKQLKLLVSLAGVSFDGGVISGAFPRGNFSLASLRNAKLDNINISGATLHYTDLREATITGGDYSKTQFVCASLADMVVLQKLPELENTTFRMTDLRGLTFSDHVVSTSSSKSSPELLANILEQAQIDSVLVDTDVYERLSAEKKTMATTSEFTTDHWFNTVLKGKHCDKLELAATEHPANTSISMLALDQ